MAFIVPKIIKQLVSVRLPTLTSGLMVTCMLSIQEVPGLIPGSANGISQHYDIYSCDTENPIPLSRD